MFFLRDKHAHSTLSCANIPIPKGGQPHTHRSKLLWQRSETKQTQHAVNLILLEAVLSWHTLYIVLPPLFTLCPWSHQSIFFFSSPSRVRKVSCRFCTGTWRSMAQCIMRPRDLRRSRPLSRTTVCCPRMSCSNCYARPRQDTEKILCTVIFICWILTAGAHRLFICRTAYLTYFSRITQNTL